MLMPADPVAFQVVVGIPSWKCAQSLILLTLTQVIVGCACTSYSSNQFIGVAPPTIASPEHASIVLRPTINSPLPWYSQVLGVVTTPLKRFGVFGWTDMHFAARATGYIEQVAESTDRFLTVDMRLEQLLLDGVELELKRPSYIRAEVCMATLRLPEPQRLVGGRRARISGRLMWDGDGFLEIHPQVAQDIEVPPR